MTNVERLREQRRAEGLRQLVDERNNRAFAAFRRVNELYGRVSTGTHRDIEIVYDSHTRITIRPTPQEMASAPLVLHWVFRRLGILATDEVEASVGIFEPDRYRNDYEWQMTPVTVTREKVGLFIQYGKDNCPVEVITVGENGQEIRGYYYAGEIDEDKGEIGDKAREVLEYYAVRTVEDSDEPLDEEMVQIYEASCEWMVELLERRKKAMFFRKLS